MPSEGARKNHPQPPEQAGPRAYGLENARGGSVTNHLKSPGTQRFPGTMDFPFAWKTPG